MKWPCLKIIRQKSTELMLTIGICWTKKSKFGPDWAAGLLSSYNIYRKTELLLEPIIIAINNYSISYCPILCYSSSNKKDFSRGAIWQYFTKSSINIPIIDINEFKSQFIWNCDETMRNISQQKEKMLCTEESTVTTTPNRDSLAIVPLQHLPSLEPLTPEIIVLFNFTGRMENEWMDE